MLWLLQYLVDLLFAGYEDPKPPTLPVVTVPIVGQESGKKAGEDNSLQSICLNTVSTDPIWRHGSFSAIADGLVSKGRCDVRHNGTAN